MGAPAQSRAAATMHPLAAPASQPPSAAIVVRIRRRPQVGEHPVSGGCGCGVVRFPIPRQKLADPPGRKTGARGLRSIMEGILLDAMFDLPSLEGVREVVISK